VVRFTPLPLYPQGESPLYPLDRRLGGTQCRSRRGGEEKNSQPQPGFEHPIIQSVALCYRTELLSRLRNSQDSFNVAHRAALLVLPSSYRKFSKRVSRKFTVYVYNMVSKIETQDRKTSGQIDTHTHTKLANRIRRRSKFRVCSVLHEIRGLGLRKLFLS
jgi:hypothetical protein